jgi:hypothetical protein
MQPVRPTAKLGLPGRNFLRSNLNRKELVEEYVSSNLSALLSDYVELSVAVIDSQ